MNGVHADQIPVSAFLQGLARLRVALGVIDSVARSAPATGPAAAALPPPVDAATSVRLVREQLGLPRPPSRFEQSMDRLIAQQLAGSGRAAAQAPGPDSATDATAGDGSRMSRSMDRIVAQHGGRRETQPST
jgi:hypothetical protein